MEKSTENKGELKRVRYLAFFAYIGKDFHGFQKQPEKLELPSIQDEIEVKKPRKFI